MRFSFILCPLMLLLFMSCEEKETNRMRVEGNVKGLKKGMLYLQKFEDTILVNIDSLRIDGNSDFSFSMPLESPEVFYLYLDKNDGNKDNDRILFFGEQGTVTITTSRDFFDTEARINGSVSHEKLEEYKKTKSRFNNVNLDLIEALFNAQKEKDSVKADSIRRLSEKNRLRSYLFTLNFALNNKDSYVAPYIALSDAPDAQLKYLDSISRSLTPEVAASKYGKALEEFINRIKAAEAGSEAD